MEPSRYVQTLGFRVYGVFPTRGDTVMREKIVAIGSEI